MNDTSAVESYFKVLSRTIGELPYDAIDRMSNALVEAYENGRAVYTFGNGGSAALASHVACDLGKGTVNGSQKRFRVISLTSNVPMMTAWANDSGYDNIFAEQLINFVRPGDIALAISGSGNSLNVLKALRVARAYGAVTLGLTGFEGGRMKELCDICVVVPSNNMQIIEDMHVCASHAIFTGIRERLFTKIAAASAASS